VNCIVWNNNLVALTAQVFNFYDFKPETCMMLKMEKEKRKWARIVSDPAFKMEERDGKYFGSEGSQAVPACPSCTGTFEEG
jgi:hypothetical protein